jgi:hypothetical protein
VNHRDRRAKRASIGVEALEGRTVLSTVSAMIVPNQGALVRGISYLYLQGTAHGTPSTVVGNPDVGTTLKLNGTSNLTVQGPMKLTGSLHGTGFIASGRVEGTITLSNGKGSFTLQLHSPAVGGFMAPRSGTYDFTFLKGTGAFRHEVGSGTVDLVLGPRAFALNFHGKPNTF